MAPVKKKGIQSYQKKKKRYSKFKSVNLAPSREWHMNWSPTHVDDPDCIDILSLHSYRETEKNWSHRTTRSSKKNGDETAGLWRMPLPKNIANPRKKKTNVHRKIYSLLLGWNTWAGQHWVWLDIELNGFSFFNLLYSIWWGNSV